MPKLLVFTDLDGTFLDRSTCSWEEARSTLNLLFALKIPIIFCSSKTHQESTYYRGQMGIEHPFIIENGAAIYSPLGYFDQPISGLQQAGYEVMAMGINYSVLQGFLNECRNKLGVRLWGFGDLTTAQIQEVTGLPLHLAELAQHREYDEPFYFLDEMSEQQLPEMKSLAEQQNLTITRSSRFYHLSGQHDKGEAVKTLVSLYQENESGEWLSVGLGDSLNDFSLLQAVDIPCLVQQTHRKYEQEIVDKLSPRLSTETAPQGWVELIMQILTEYKLV